MNHTIKECIIVADVTLNELQWYMIFQLQLQVDDLHRFFLGMLSVASTLMTIVVFLVGLHPLSLLFLFLGWCFGSLLFRS